MKGDGEMGKTTGFLEYERSESPIIPEPERIHNFEEFHIYLNEKTRRLQAARCMDCGVPLCQSAMKLKSVPGIM